MPEKPETVPGDEAIAVVTSQVVDHLLRRLSEEIGHPLAVSVSVVRDGVVIRELGEMRSNGAEPAQRGQVRMRFRSTYAPDRHLFFVDAVFEPDERTPSVSGILVRGDVREQPGQTLADFKTWVVKRNDWDWAKWL